MSQYNKITPEGLKAALEYIKENPSVIKFNDGGLTDPPETPPNSSDSLNIANSAKEVFDYYADKDYRISYTSTGEGSIGDGMIESHKPGGIDNRIYTDNPSYYIAGSNKGEEISFGEYFKAIDNNQYLKREGTREILDTRSPMVRYDERIAPQGEILLINEDKEDPYYTDRVYLPVYDPIAVTPWNKLSSEEQKARLKYYGGSGTPFSNINKTVTHNEFSERIKSLMSGKESKPEGTLDPKKSINVNLIKQGYAKDTKSANTFKKSLWSEVYPGEEYKQTAAQNAKLNSWVFDNEDKLAEFKETGTVKQYKERIEGEDEPIVLPTRKVEHVDTNRPEHEIIRPDTPIGTRRYSADKGKWIYGEDTGRGAVEKKLDEERWEWAKQNKYMNGGEHSPYMVDDMFSTPPVYGINYQTGMGEEVDMEGVTGGIDWNTFGGQGILDELPPTEEDDYASMLQSKNKLSRVEKDYLRDEGFDRYPTSYTSSTTPDDYKRNRWDRKSDREARREGNPIEDSSTIDNNIPGGAWMVYDDKKGWYESNTKEGEKIARKQERREKMQSPEFRAGLMGASMIGNAVTDLMGGVRNSMSVVAMHNRNRYVEDWYNKQMQRNHYTPVSQTANSNYTGGNAFGELGGEMGHSLEKYLEGGDKGRGGKYGDVDWDEYWSQRDGVEGIPTELRDRKEARRVAKLINSRIKGDEVIGGVDYGQFSRVRTRDFIQDGEEVPQFNFGGEQVVNTVDSKMIPDTYLKEGQFVEFEYEGKKYKGTVKKNKDGKIYI